MSRRSSEENQPRVRKNGLKKHSGGWVGFVDFPLSSEQKEHLAALPAAEYPDAAEFLQLVLDDGYKVSLVKDEKHNCVIATLTGKGTGCLNAGYSLSARGPDMYGALLVLHYKHVTLCDEQRWDGQQDATSSQMSLWDQS